MSAAVPYCGSPPVPETAVWNLDPILIGTLLVEAVLYLWVLQSPSWRFASAVAGWGIVALALVTAQAATWRAPERALFSFQPLAQGNSTGELRSRLSDVAHRSPFTGPFVGPQPLRRRC
jgi:hypothetical protein